MLHDPFVIWCAGFFDGEGSVSIPRARKADTGNLLTDNQMWLQVQIPQIGRRVLDDIAARFGGRVCIVSSGRKSYSKPLYRWLADGDKALAFLEAVEPYLRVKRALVEPARRFQSTVRTRRVVLRDVAAAAKMSTREFFAHTSGREFSARADAAVKQSGWLSDKEVFDIRLAIKAEVQTLNATRES